MFTLHIAFDLTENFVRLNPGTSFSFDWMENFVNLICIWFDGKIREINESSMHATWFAFYLTENFVKLNTVTWFASDLTEKFVK